MGRLLAGALLALIATPALADILAGTWTLTINTVQGERNPTLEVVRDGDSYSGVYNSLRGPIEVEEILVDGSSFSFSMVVTVPIGDIDVTYRGTVDGDSMSGSAQNPRGEVPFTAKRTASE